MALENPVPDTELLAHPPGTAGALMVPEFPSVAAEARVSDALASLRDLGENRHEFNRVYAVDEDGSLAGQLTMVDLALLPERTQVRDVMDPVPATVTADTSAGECARLLRHYNVVQLPVVADGWLAGVIPLEFLLGAMVEEDTREMLNVGGVSGESRENPVLSAVRTRLPWLTVNLATTFLAAAVITLFESTPGPGGNPRRVPAGGGGPGRHRRHSDPDDDRPLHGPGRVRRDRGLETAGSGSPAGTAPRPLAWDPRRSGRHAVDS